MFVSAGEAGDAKKMQTSVAAARKVFRIFRASMLSTSCLAETRQAWLFVHCFGCWDLVQHHLLGMLLAAAGSSFTGSPEPYS